MKIIRTDLFKRDFCKMPEDKMRIYYLKHIAGFFDNIFNLYPF